MAVRSYRFTTVFSAWLQPATNTTNNSPAPLGSRLNPFQPWQSRTEGAGDAAGAVGDAEWLSPCIVTMTRDFTPSNPPHHPKAPAASVPQEQPLGGS